MKKVAIKTINNVTSEGVSFTLNHPATLNTLKTKEYWVSWDRIGKALFPDEYTDAETVQELKEVRG